MNNKNKYQYSIEIVGSCNLRCPSCPVGNMNTREVAKKMIPKDLFVKIIDKIAHESPVTFPTISVFDWGEPTLHPELPFFIKYINQKKLKSRVSSNLNVSADFGKIMEAQPHEFKISLSGFSEKTYSFTHRRGKIEKVIDNMKKISSLKKKYNNATKVIVGYHLYRHNLMEDFKKMQNLSNELDFIFEPDIAHFMPIEKILSLVKNECGAKVDLDLPEITDEDKKLINYLLSNPKKEYMKWIKNPKKDKTCTRLEYKTAIRVDGSVPICCGVYSDKYIVSKSFLELSFEEIKQKRMNYDLCGTCVSNGVHTNWKSSKSDFLNKYIANKGVIGKLVRAFYSQLN